uniref:Uncharacterized protein n=2 Tax=Tetranychus urticae TaxID=32264 RepID=T1L2G4_TETUR
MNSDLARFDHICKASLKAIKEGYFDLRINERAECREKAVPENIMTALTKCEATLPMDSQQAVKDACANEAENAPKWAQVWDCKEKAFGKNYDAMLAYALCTLNQGAR